MARDTSPAFAIAALAAAAAFAIGLSIGRSGHSAPAPILRDTAESVRVDTLRVPAPYPVRDTLLRYVAVRLPAFRQGGEADSIAADSAAVSVPITQRRYADTLYEAWVSGFDPRLDSIRLYPRTVVRTVSVSAPAPKQRRWSIGVQAGCGLTPRGVQPYVGVGVAYTIGL